MTSLDLGNPGLRVAALYRFVALPEFAALRQPLAQFCCARGIKGTLLLASEGINGTVAGAPGAIDELMDWLRSIPALRELEVKFSIASEMPFHRMKVRLKREIVTMGVEGIDPNRHAGTYVTASDWNALIDDPDTLVIDTRNDYEVALGTFKGAVDPGTKSFTEFPDWARANVDNLRNRKVAMFCTGGIRCEKATAFVRSLGIDDVFHLKGGILRYLEITPREESLWDGECFVFDERVSVVHGLGEGDAELCRACRRPLTRRDLGHPDFESGVSCHHCKDVRSDEDRARYAERQRQVELAEKKGVAPHIGK